MRNAKLWSVLCAAVLLCACVAGVLFTGASASDTRIPTATVTYVVGTDGANISACLDKAAGETWGKNDVLEIQFSGEDASAKAGEEGSEGSILFGAATIFREDDTQLPIVIRGTDESRGATVLTDGGIYNATNDYFFTNLTVNGGASADAPVTLYAGSGELVFENTKNSNFSYTWYYGDCQLTDAWEGWDEAKIAANKGDKDLVETGIVFGNGTKFYESIASDAPNKYQRLSAVGFDGDATTNAPIIALRRATGDVSGALTEDQVESVRATAQTATYTEGALSAEDCPVKPWDTQAYLVLDSGTAKPSSPEFGFCGARFGVSPVREAKIEMISGGVEYLSAGAHISAMNETYVGNTAVFMRGGKTTSNSVGIRLTNEAMLVGDLTLEIHEDDESIPTQTKFVQAAQSGAKSTVFGNYHFLMTGGTVGNGHSIAKVNSSGDQVVSSNKLQWTYSDGNDGYWGAPLATGTIVNEVRGGQIWAFYSSRYANTYENTPVSIVLPGTGETLTAKVSVHNIISGGIIGGPEVQGTRTDSTGKVIDVQNGTKAYYGGAKTSETKITSVCNEITGGTIYDFRSNSVSTSRKYQPDDVYNFVYGTEDKYPTFLCDFYGTRGSGGYNITNVIKGYPKFNDGTSKRLIYGGCKTGTITRVTNYFGGMPEFLHLYGGCSGSSNSNGTAAVQYLNSHFAFDYTDTKISGEIYAGNGYYQVEGLDGVTETKGQSGNYTTYELNASVYSGHYGTIRLESASGKDITSGDNMTFNVYGGTWAGAFMAANRSDSRTSTTYSAKTLTNNIYDATIKGNMYMGGQNSRNTNVVNNIYGGTFEKTYYGAGDDWAKTVVNNIYGGTFKASYYGGGYQCGTESVVNNIYGGNFSDSADYMGSYMIATDEDYHNAGSIENNFYGAKMGKGWTYGGHRNGYAATIKNHFYSGADNPCRDPENALYEYYDEATMLEGGTHLRDQFLAGCGYNEAYVDINTVDSIENTFEGGLFTKAAGAGADITIHGGMRWGVVGNVTNSFIKGNYYRFYGGCDYGRVTGTVTNTFGKALAEGEEAPVLTFANYVMGGGLDQTDTPAAEDNTGYQRIPLSEKIKIALAVPEADRTGRAAAWASVAATYGEDFEGGAEYIVNNVYYGTYHQFTGGSVGCQESTYYAISNINTITNNIYGGTFAKREGENTVFNGGCFRNAVIETGIINNISGGTFNGNIYGGSIGTGSLSCPVITNTVSGGTGNVTENAYFYLGNGAPDFTGVVKSTVNDFNAGKTYVMGGSTNKHVQPDGAEYAIETTVNGGTFCGFWGQGGGTTSVLEGNIKTTVNGGTFNGYNDTDHMRNAIAGGARNGSTKGNIELILNDGVFTADVVGGVIWGSETNSLKLIDGNVTVTVKGGDFREDIYAVCRVANAIEVTGTATVNVEQTAGVALKLGGEAEIDSFASNSETVDIDAEANIVIKSLTGKLCVNQVVGWQAHDYLYLPANCEYAIAEAEGIYGSYVKESDANGILITGSAVAPAAATIRLAERLGVRILLNKTDVDPYGEAFTYAVTFKDEVIAEGTKATLEDYSEDYYSFVFDGIGLSDFGEYATISGSCMRESLISIAGLAEQAVIEWQEEGYANWKAYAEAILELHSVYNKNAENTLAPDAVSFVPFATKGQADGIVSAKATLLMADAAGLRLEVTLNAAPANAKILVNGYEINERMVSVSENTITADLYFAHEYLADTFVVSVVTDAGEHMSYTASIESLAAQLASDEQNVNKDNATAFLVYIQKAVACK